MRTSAEVRQKRTAEFVWKSYELHLYLVSILCACHRRLILWSPPTRSAASWFITWPLTPSGQDRAWPGGSHRPGECVFCPVPSLFRLTVSAPVNTSSTYASVWLIIVSRERLYNTGRSAVPGKISPLVWSLLLYLLDEFRFKYLHRPSHVHMSDEQQ